MLNESWYQSLRQKLYGHLALARISNSPTVVTNTLAGAALTGARQIDGRQALVAIAMILFYSAGMYLNDLLDYTIDCRERPKRPLPAGIISRRAAAISIIVLFGSGSILLWSVGLYPFLSGLVLIVLIICYDRWHKSNPFSSLLMALCRGMVYLTAFLAFSLSSILNLTLPGCLLILYIIGLTSIAKTENPRREQNRSTPVGTGFVPVRRALRRPLSLSDITRFGILATLFLPTTYLVLRPSLLTLLIVLLFTAWVVYSISFIYKSPQPQIGRTVGQLIAGISLLDSLVLVVSEHYAGLLLALIAFGLTLFLQRYVKGT